MKIILSFVVLILIASCNSSDNDSGNENIATTDSSYKTVVPQTAVINAENYTGTLPCADCEGIDVALQLNKDSSYVMNSVYKGVADTVNNHFVENGKWSMHGNDTLYLLNDKNHPTKYIKTNATLTQLDGDGKIITGSLAKMFVLHKK